MSAAQSPQDGLYAPSVWSLQLGSPARDLSVEEFIDFACGTNGGPPSTPLANWSDFGTCEPEAQTGLREVYFQYDDQPEYIAKAMRLGAQARLYEHTSVYEIPVIASALFDEDGFLVGLRLHTDPRVDIETREKGAYLANFLMARFDGAMTCTDLPRAEGETDYVGAYIKRRCSGRDPASATRLTMESHLYRKPGQSAVDPATNLPTEGQFESTTRFEQVLDEPIVDRDARLTAPRDPGVQDKEALVRRALNCPGCDLAGANLKRASLQGARLAGADLSGANLHAADLTGADLTGAKLTGANLNRAVLLRARLPGADLQRAFLYEARLDGADLSGANLTAVLAGYVRLARANLTDAQVSQSDLSGARLGDANLSGADVSRSGLNDAQMSRANMTGTILIKASLWRARLTSANLTGADLRGADLYGADLREGDLRNADFSESRLTAANLTGTQRDGAKFIGALLPLGFDPADR